MVGGKRKKKAAVMFLCMSLLISLLAGCNAVGAAGAGESSAENAVTGITAENVGQADGQETAESSAIASTDTMFTERDFETAYEESDCISIVLSDDGIRIGDADSADDTAADGVSADGTTVTITKEGTYLLSGSLSDGQIVVDADENTKLQLIFNNVEIGNADSAPLYIKEADKVFVTLADGSRNQLSTTGEFAETAEDEDNIDAVIFSKADLTLNGNGSLYVATDTGNGITSKDDLVFTGGSYSINAGNHGLEGKDSVRIAAGVYNLVTGQDGIHSSNTEDEDKGFVYILDGELEIQAADDGIHAEKNVTVNGGTITITDGYEGIEGMSIDLNGGSISVTVSDDGLNAAGGNDASGMQGNDFANADRMQGAEADSSVYIKITGGSLTIDAQGDGIDSNGALYVSGGETYVTGASNNGNGALDYGGTAEITGGIFVAAGASGMAQNFQDTSTQGSILVNAASMQTGAAVLTDADGQELLRYTPVREYNSVLISIPEIIADGTYTVIMGDETQEITLDGLVYGSSGGMFGGGRGMNGGGDRKNGEMNGTGGGPRGEGGTTPPNAEAGEMPQAPPDGEAGEMPQAPPDGETGEMPQAPYGGEGGGMTPPTPK